jgi:hypothetical protein
MRIAGFEFNIVANEISLVGEIFLDDLLSRGAGTRD